MSLDYHSKVVINLLESDDEIIAKENIQAKRKLCFDRMAVIVRCPAVRTAHMKKSTGADKKEAADFSAALAFAARKPVP